MFNALLCAHHRNYLQQLLCRYLNYAAWGRSADKHQQIRATFILSRRSRRSFVSLRVKNAQAAGMNEVYPKTRAFPSLGVSGLLLTTRRVRTTSLQSSGVWTQWPKLPCGCSQPDWMTSSPHLHMNQNCLRAQQRSQWVSLISKADDLCTAQNHLWVWIMQISANPTPPKKSISSSWKICCPTCCKTRGNASFCVMHTQLNLPLSALYWVWCQIQSVGRGTWLWWSHYGHI